MLRLWWRRLSVVVLFFIVAACSGGGCSSGCAGCGTTPLPGGFPKANTITNAASVRVTRQGLDFMGQNLGTIAGKLLGGGADGGAMGGVIHFNVPDSKTKITFINIEICKSPGAGQCVADIDLGMAKLRIDSANYTQVSGEPAIRISGTVPVKIDDIPVDTSLGGIDIGIGNGGCSGGTPNVTYADVPVEIILPLINETISPRDGYTKIDTKNAVVNATIDSGIVQICGGILASIVDLFKSYIVGQITGPLQSTLKNTLQTQLCTKPSMLNPPCPTGSMPSSDNSQCVYTSDPATCVPTELGLDGHIDLSGLLAKISPGTSGGLDFVFASGGDMLPTTSVGNVVAPDGMGQTTNGVTLGFIGGATPQPTSNCVPVFDNKIPTGIPIPDELEANNVTPWPMGDTGPDLGIALSGRFLNFAFGSVYNSGLLCLGVSTEQFAQLQSGLLSVLIKSINSLTFEHKPSPVAIVTRPQKPPVVTIGGGTDVTKDPLLTIGLNSFSIDFYVWSLDRFVRIFTFTGDLSIPINLSTAKDPKTNPNGGLLPVLGGINIGAGSKVTNADLLTDDPTAIAASLSSLLGAVAGQFLGSIKPIDLSTLLSKYGIALTIPAGGIRKLSKGTDDYVGIFADLALAMGAANGEADVHATLVSKTVHPEAMGLATARRELLPELKMAFSSNLDNGSHFVEYSYAVDEGTRSEWKQGRDVTIQNDALFLQGKHVLHVWAREVGVPMSESSVPADVPFTIDVLAPMVDVSEKDGAVNVDAWDIVSAPEELSMRFRAVDAAGKAGDFGPWMPVRSVTYAELGGEAASIGVEVKDGEGNVASQSQPLVRGRPDPTQGASGGCGGCAEASQSDKGLVWGLPAIAGLLGLAHRRKRKLASKGAAAEGQR